MHSQHSVTLLLAIVLFSFTSAVPTRSIAARGVGSLKPAYNVDNPAATPIHQPPPPQKLFSENDVSQIFLAHLNHDSLPTSSASNTTSVTEVVVDMMQGLNVKIVGIIQDSVEGGLNTGDTVYPVKRQLVTARKATTSVSGAIQAGQVACVGTGTTVNLCPNARILLTNDIFFYAANQTLQTQGNPTGTSRATLVVTGADQSCAIYGAVEKADGTALRNVQIDGNRQNLGILYGALANIEMGGNSNGQIIDRVHSFEPRGWSTLHAVEGYQNACNGMIITNNDIGPAGHAPTGAQQFRRRDSTGVYTPGQWADGISVACKGSYVAGNTITDATDGAIVLFGAPGTQVTGNTIIASTRQLLGGINMVDWSPYSGSYAGTTVTNNQIKAQSEFIKVGVGLGTMVWGVDNRTIARTFGGTVTGNTFSSGSTGYFGFAIGQVGSSGATVSGNSAKRANFGGVYSSSCFPQYPNGSPKAFVADPYTTPGSVYNAGTVFQQLVLLICSGPGPILTRGNPI